MPDSSGALALFKQHFNQTAPQTVRAPGRLELLGNHVDYNQGLVLSVAVDKYIELAFAPRRDGKIELIADAFPQPEIFWADRLEKNPAAPWANYIKGVLAQLRQRGVHFTGFNAAVHGTIPMGAGMSSSAALEVATALMLRQLHPYALTENGLAPAPLRDGRGQLPPMNRFEKLQCARLCRAAEAEFVGVNCGLLDQISSLFGKALSVMEIDFRSLSVETAPLAGEAIIVCDSGVKHELVAGTYNKLREDCETAAHKLRVTSLRQADPKMVEANRDKLSVREYECARHVTGEIQRVTFAIRALQEGDHRQLGEYLFQSHDSSRDLLKNSTPELDILVELAASHSACLGARLTGGGFGGATINLVTHHEAGEFMEYMAREYKKKTGHAMEPILCQIVDGAA